jgi:hypothetical protein
VNDHGNSGVYFRVPEIAVTRYRQFPDGYEANINSTHADLERTGSLTGSLRGLAPFKEVLHKPDEWFTLEVIARGERIIIQVNGQTTVDFVDANRSFRRAISHCRFGLLIPWCGSAGSRSESCQSRRERLIPSSRSEAPLVISLLHCACGLFCGAAPSAAFA